VPMIDDSHLYPLRLPEPTHVRDVGQVPGWDGRMYRIQMGCLGDRWFARASADDDPYYYFREFSNESAARRAAEALFYECTVEPEMRMLVEGSFGPGMSYHISLTGTGDIWHLKTRCADDPPRFRRFGSAEDAIIELFVALVCCRSLGWKHHEHVGDTGRPTGPARMREGAKHDARARTPADAETPARDERAARAHSARANETLSRETLTPYAPDATASDSRTGQLPTEDESTRDSPTSDQPRHNPARDDGARERPARGEPTHERPAHERSTHEGPARTGAVHERAAHDRTVHDSPAPNDGRGAPQRRPINGYNHKAGVEALQELLSRGFDRDDSDEQEHDADSTRKLNEQ
jgi:hypothetical protein